MRLADMPIHGDWVLLGEDPPHEIAFGVIGRFWAGETVWAQIEATDFEGSRSPASARSLSLRARLAGVGSLSHRFCVRPWSARPAGFGATPSRDLGSSAVTARRPLRSPVTSTRRRGDLAARSEWR